MLLKNLSVRVAVIEFHLRKIVVKMRNIGVRMLIGFRAAAAERFERYVADFVFQFKESAQNLMIILLRISSPARNPVNCLAPFPFSTGDAGLIDGRTILRLCSTVSTNIGARLRTDILRSGLLR